MIFKVEFEIPPFRAIHFATVHEVESLEEAEKIFLEVTPEAKIINTTEIKEGSKL